MAKKPGKWLQEVGKRIQEKGTEGKTHRMLGVPEDEPIPMSKIDKALKQKGLSVTKRKEFQFAKNMKHLAAARKAKKAKTTATASTLDTLQALASEMDLEIVGNAVTARDVVDDQDIPAYTSLLLKRFIQKNIHDLSGNRTYLGDFLADLFTELPSSDSKTLQKKIGIVGIEHGSEEDLDPDDREEDEDDPYEYIAYRGDNSVRMTSDIRPTAVFDNLRELVESGKDSRLVGIVRKLCQKYSH